MPLVRCGDAGKELVRQTLPGHPRRGGRPSQKLIDIQHPDRPVPAFQVLEGRSKRPAGPGLHVLQDRGRSPIHGQAVVVGSRALGKRHGIALPKVAQPQAAIGREGLSPDALGPAPLNREVQAESYFDVL